MKSSTRNELSYLIASMVILIGATRIMTSIIQSRSVPNPETYEGFDRYIGYHLDAYPGLVFLAIGLAFLAYSIISREIPLWRMKETGMYKSRRSALIVSIGTGVAVLGFGTAAILLYMIHGMPKGVADYESNVTEWNELARVRAVAGLVGLAILGFGVLFSKEPELELGEEKSLLYKKPFWQGALVLALGIAMALTTWFYGVFYNESYVEREEEARLTLIVFFGMGFSFLVFLIGLTMIANRVPTIRFRGQLYPLDPEYYHKK